MTHSVLLYCEGKTGCRREGNTVLIAQWFRPALWTPQRERRASRSYDWVQQAFEMFYFLTWL